MWALTSPPVHLRYVTLTLVGSNLLGMMERLVWEEPGCGTTEEEGAPLPPLLQTLACFLRKVGLEYGGQLSTRTWPLGCHFHRQ